MLAIIRSKKVFPVLCACLGLLLGLSTWYVLRPHTFQGSIDMPIYSSIEQLATAPDLNAVVIGTVKGIAGHEIDYGGEGPETGSIGIQDVFYNVEVSAVLRGTTEKNIVVVIPDTKIMQFGDSVTGWKSGDRLLLFLSAQNPQNAPGIKSFTHFYAPISLDNGVFDILPGDIAQPRMIEVFAKADTNPNTTTTFTLAEIIQKIASIQ